MPAGRIAVPFTLLALSQGGQPPARLPARPPAAIDSTAARQCVPTGRMPVLRPDSATYPHPPMPAALPDSAAAGAPGPTLSGLGRPARLRGAAAGAVSLARRAA
jgi:hypothetical protein